MNHTPWRSGRTKMVSRNSSFCFYHELILTCGRMQRNHVCEILHIFLLLKSFLHHSLNETLLLLYYLSHFLHLVPCIWEFQVLKINFICTLDFCMFNLPQPSWFVCLLYSLRSNIFFGVNNRTQNRQEKKII